MRDTDACFRGRLEVIRGWLELLPDGLRMLEVGVATGNVLEDTNHILDRKGAAYVGVDVSFASIPQWLRDKYTFMQVTSDDYFAGLPPHVKFDLVFIDGGHDSPQPEHDVKNSVQHLNAGGVIVIHDMSSKTYDSSSGTRAAFKLLLEDPRFFCKLYVWDEKNWLGSTAVGVDMDRHRTLELFNQENKE